MQPDYLFVAAGIIALYPAVRLFWRGLRQRQYGCWQAGLLWAIFAAGLLTQGFAPHLRVEQNRFVVPASAITGTGVSARDIVTRERVMHNLAAILTGGAALGLALCYRKALFLPTGDVPQGRHSGEDVIHLTGC